MIIWINTTIPKHTEGEKCLMWVFQWLTLTFLFYFRTHPILNSHLALNQTAQSTNIQTLYIFFYIRFNGNLDTCKVYFYRLIISLCFTRQNCNFYMINQYVLHQITGSVPNPSKLPCCLLLT